VGPKKQARGFDEGSCRSNDLRCETAPSGSVSDALAVSVLAQFRSHGAFEAREGEPPLHYACAALGWIRCSKRSQAK
jgi:hypothetical protein